MISSGGANHTFLLKFQPDLTTVCLCSVEKVCKSGFRALLVDFVVITGMKKPLIGILLCFLTSTGHAFTLFGDSEITKYGFRENPKSTVTVDHVSWDGFLAKYVKDRNGISIVAYSSVSTKDARNLRKYIDSLGRTEVSQLARQEQFAYWVNLYNALTVRVILDHYPVNSIKDISYNLFSQGPWAEPLVSVEGFELSLDDIEHQILRPVFRDSRIHYAVNCASFSCPNLQGVAFTRDNLELLLDRGAQQYINHSRGVNIVNNEIVLSRIYDWYARDFGDSESEILSHLKRYADDDLKSKLEGKNVIAEYVYDWALNE